MCRSLASALLCLSILAGCAQSVDPVVEVAAVPEPAPMAWDHRPEGQSWTMATMDALAEHGRALVNTVPEDVADWCPGYAMQGEEGRTLFWTAILSALAEHESTWRPEAVGGGGRWFGLVQIAPATASGYGCAAQSGNALKNGGANLSCAVRIASHTVPRDGVVAAGGRGLAADWGPFHSSAKRNHMRHWLRAQPYCQVSH